MPGKINYLFCVHIAQVDNTITILFFEVIRPIRRTCLAIFFTLVIKGDIKRDTSSKSENRYYFVTVWEGNSDKVQPCLLCGCLTGQNTAILENPMPQIQVLKGADISKTLLSGIFCWFISSHTRFVSRPQNDFCCYL